MRKFGIPGNLPQIPVRIGKVPGITSPIGRMGGLDDPAPRGGGFLQQTVRLSR